MFIKDKELNPEFYNIKSMGKLIKDECPGLEDDYYNKQRLVEARLESDKFDQEFNFYDLNIKNVNRLNALDEQRF